jgi:predicted dehydrogenase
MEKSNNTRRGFIKSLGAVSAAGVAVPAILRGQAQDESVTMEAKSYTPKKSANDRIQVACVGLGHHGYGNMMTLKQYFPDVEIVAVSDLYDGRLTRAKEVFGKDVFTSRRYEDVLARDDVDAVFVATSDNWHAQVSIDALKTGKSVQCEKPMVQRMQDGPPVIAAEGKSKGILLGGSEQMDSIVIAKAKQLYREGAIGELNFVEAYVDRFSATGAWTYAIPPDASAKTIDWDRFQAYAPKIPFDADRFFRWRKYRDYGTGVAGDLFVHYLTTVHHITDSAGPSQVASVGGIRYWHDGRDMPDVSVALYDYPKTRTNPNFTFVTRVNMGAGSGTGGLTRLVGSEGEMVFNFNGLTLTRSSADMKPHSDKSFAEATQKAMAKTAKKPPKPKKHTTKFVAPEGYRGKSFDHFVTWFEAIRSGKSPTQNSTFGYRAAAAALLANQAYFEKRTINWDAEKMREV